MHEGRPDLVRQLALAATLPTLLALLLTGAMVASAYAAAITATTRTLAPELARLSAARLAAELDDLAAALESTPAGQADLILFDGGIVTLDATNTVIDSPEPMWYGENWSNRDIVRGLNATSGTTIGTLADPTGQGENYAAIAAFHPAAEGQEAATLIGLLCVADQASTLGTLAEAARVDTASALMLVDARGIVLAYTRPEGIERDLSNKPAVREVLLGKTGAIATRDINGSRVIAAYTPLPDTPWNVVLELERQRLVIQAWRNGQPVLGLAAIGASLLLILAPAMMITRRAGPIFEELRELNAVIRRTATDLTGTELATPAFPRDEITALKQDFAVLAAQTAETHARLAMSDRALLLAQAWQKVVQDRDPDDSVQTVAQKLCQFAVEIGKCRLAWVGEEQRDVARTIRPIAVVEAVTEGQDDTAIARSSIWAESARGRGPAGTAIRTGAPVLIEDVSLEPQEAEWTSAAHQYGCRGILALPLYHRGETNRVIILYTIRPFDPNAVAVLCHALAVFPCAS